VTDFNPLAFYLIAIATVGCALGVVIFKNLIFSAISMVSCFTGITGIYILLHAELLAAAQVLIYVGAISILILFAIMLTRHRSGDISIFFHRQSWVAIPIVVLVFIVLAGVLATARYSSSLESLHSGTSEIADILFNQYAFPFEAVSLVLLVAMVGAVLLAAKEKKP
jgi:NADH:ubiquinone oxidoreductase subunit 6 (subunit J)